MKHVKITPKESVGHGEAWMEWFNCPNCNESDIMRGFAYCPNCGARLDHVFETEEVKQSDIPERCACGLAFMGEKHACEFQERK